MRQWFLRLNSTILLWKYHKLMSPVWDFNYYLFKILKQDLKVQKKFFNYLHLNWINNFLPRIILSFLNIYSHYSMHQQNHVPLIKIFSSSIHYNNIMNP
jgi:hypothetical protein